MTDIQEIIGYNLPDALNALPDGNAPLKVGAKDGTNFFYVGTVADFQKNLDKIDKENHGLFKLYAEKSMLDLEAEVKRFPNLPIRMTSETMMLGAWVSDVKFLAGSLNSSVRWLDFLSDCGKWADKIKEKRRKAKNAKTRFQQFIPLRQRGVMDAFYADPAADPARPIVLIVSGYEIGKYWTVWEAE